MFKFITPWLARKLDKGSITSPKIYVAIITILMAAQSMLADPDFIAFLQATFPDSPMLAKAIIVVPTFIAGMLRPRTLQHMQPTPPKPDGL